MQTTITFDLFSTPTNNAVLRMPGRAYPGVLVQGDTLAALVETAREIQSLMPVGARDSDLADRVCDIRKRLEGMLSWYEQSLSDAGLTLPYMKVPNETE